MNQSAIEDPLTGKHPQKLFIAHTVGIATFVILKAVASLIPQAIANVFSLPAAMLASIFLAAPLETTSKGEINLHHHSIDISVTGACSGFAFFALICALTAGFGVIRFSRTQWFRDFPVLLALGYLLTSLTNSFRMVCAVQIRLFTDQWIPEAYDSSIHMMVGMVVFIPVLLLSWNLLHRYYDRH